MMYRSIRKWLKDFFTLSKNEQRGILVLLFFIILVLLVNGVVVPILPHAEPEQEDTAFQRQISQFIAARQRMEDSIQTTRLQNKGRLKRPQALLKIHPFPFDPNLMNQDLGKKLGLSEKQVLTLQNYLRKGGRFKKKDDFKKMYCISDAEYEILAPYIHFQHSQKKTKLIYHTVQLNRCDSADLVHNLHLSSFLARRIIKFRTALGNFYTQTQLKEVYGLTPETYQKIAPYLHCDSSQVQKIDLNNASFKELLHHPYLNYDNTLKIAKIRSRLHGYARLEQLKTDAYIPDSVYRKIRPYLYLRPQKMK
ncbi:MAG: helix-hairpin-helix domain-containing protein [Bacteroidales bacterium]|nr:helix-hairpin-helix domain-containing protein [Bacteroidales bacterium]